MTKPLKCDKPVDLDEARKAKGLPRRKRDDPKATAYELRIRVPAEFQGVMGRKKLSRTVFARNKREELRARIAEFEEDANRMLEDRTTGVGIGAQDVSPLSPATPFGEYVERYIALRSNGAIGRQTLANERRYAEYLREVIGLIPLRDLTAMDVERARGGMEKETRAGGARGESTEEEAARLPARCRARYAAQNPQILPRDPQRRAG